LTSDKKEGKIVLKISCNNRPLPSGEGVSSPWGRQHNSRSNRLASEATGILLYPYLQQAVTSLSYSILLKVSQYLKNTKNTKIGGGFGGGNCGREPTYLLHRYPLYPSILFLYYSHPKSRKYFCALLNPGRTK